MIKKETFVAILKTLEEYDKKETELNKAMNNISLTTGAFYPLSCYKSIIIDLLNQIFYGKIDFKKENISDIDYFIYDCEYGKKADIYFITKSNGEEIHLTDAEVLYDYLIKETKNDTEKDA